MSGLNFILVGGSDRQRTWFRDTVDALGFPVDRLPSLDVTVGWRADPAVELRGEAAATSMSRVDYGVPTDVSIYFLDSLDSGDRSVDGKVYEFYQEVVAHELGHVVTRGFWSAADEEAFCNLIDAEYPGDYTRKKWELSGRECAAELFKDIYMSRERRVFTNRTDYDVPPFRYSLIADLYEKTLSSGAGEGSLEIDYTGSYGSGDPVPIYGTPFSVDTYSGSVSGPYDPTPYAPYLDGLVTGYGIFKVVVTGSDTPGPGELFNSAAPGIRYDVGGDTALYGNAIPAYVITEAIAAGTQTVVLYIPVDPDTTDPGGTQYLRYPADWASNSFYRAGFTPYTLGGVYYDAVAIEESIVFPVAADLGEELPPGYRLDDIPSSPRMSWDFSPIADDFDYIWLELNWINEGGNFHQVWYIKTAGAIGEASFANYLINPGPIWPVADSVDTAFFTDVGIKETGVPVDVPSFALPGPTILTPRIFGRTLIDVGSYTALLAPGTFWTFDGVEAPPRQPVDREGIGIGGLTMGTIRVGQK